MAKDEPGLDGVIGETPLLTVSLNFLSAGGPFGVKAQRFGPVGSGFAVKPIAPASWEPSEETLISRAVKPEAPPPGGGQPAISCDIADIVSSGPMSLRAYFARPTARRVIRARARCCTAGYVPASFSRRTEMRRNRFIQPWVRSTTRPRARNPASRRIARACSPLRTNCAVKPNSCTTARTSWESYPLSKHTPWSSPATAGGRSA